MASLANHLPLIPEQQESSFAWKSSDRKTSELSDVSASVVSTNTPNSWYAGSFDSPTSSACEVPSNVETESHLELDFADLPRYGDWENATNIEGQRWAGHEEADQAKFDLDDKGRLLFTEGELTELDFREMPVLGRIVQEVCNKLQSKEAANSLVDDELVDDSNTGHVLFGTGDLEIPDIKEMPVIGRICTGASRLMREAAEDVDGERRSDDIQIYDKSDGTLLFTEGDLELPDFSKMPAVLALRRAGKALTAAWRRRRERRKAAAQKKL